MGAWDKGITFHNVYVNSHTDKSVQIKLPRRDGMDNELLWVPLSQVEGGSLIKVGLECTFRVTAWWWSKVEPSLKTNNVDMSFLKNTGFADMSIFGEKMALGAATAAPKPAMPHSLTTPADCEVLIEDFAGYFKNPTDLENALNNALTIQHGKLCFTLNFDVENLLLNKNLEEFKSQLIQKALEKWFQLEEIPF